MTKVTAASLEAGLWYLDLLRELPRDMHCSHEREGDAATSAGLAQCPDCRRVLEVMEALRNERPS